METRRAEKPTLLSRRVLRTNRVNVSEAVKLKTTLTSFSQMQKQKTQARLEDVEGLKGNLRKIGRVKEKMEVSAMRRKFLADYGVSLKVRDVNMNEFVSAVGENLSGKGRKSSSMPKDRDDERFSEIESVYSSTNSTSSFLSSNASHDHTSHVVTSSRDYQDPPNHVVAKHFPLHVSIDQLTKSHRLKKKDSHIESVSIQSEDDSDSEADRLSEGAASFKASQSRPGSGSQTPMLFRRITAPTTGRRICDVYKQLEEEEKMVQKLVEKEKFNERVKKDEAVRQQLKLRDRIDSAASGRSGYRLPAVAATVTKLLGKSPVHNTALTEKSTASEEPSETDLGPLHSRLGQEAVFLNETTTQHKEPVMKQRKQRGFEDEFDELMKRSLQLSDERKQRPKSVGCIREINAGDNFEYPNSIPENKDPSFQTKDNLAALKTASSSQSKDELGGHLETEGNVKTRHKKTAWSEDVGPFENEKSSENEKGDNELEEGLSDQSPESIKWRELVKKIQHDLKRGHQRAQSSTSLARRKSSRGIRPTSVGLSDTRPSKSVTKGYATMQMTVGKKVVSIFVPRFKNEVVCKGQTAGRANVKSCYQVEQVREKRELQIKKRSSTLEG